MKKLLQAFCLVLFIVNVSAQTVTLPPYYGVQSSTFKCGVSTVKDYEGNTYNTVKIGNQCWLRENLKNTKLNDGTLIPLVIDSTWYNLTPAYCWYDNNISNKEIYGALYNWTTVNTSKLCPIGWHVPSDSEWTTLSDYLGGESVAGGKLKEAGTAHWASPNTGATNETGFTAFPGGNRMYVNFGNIGVHGLWWTGSLYSGEEIWMRAMSNYDSILIKCYFQIRTGASVRCVKD